MKIIIDTNGNFGPEVNGNMGLFARDLEQSEVLAIREAMDSAFPADPAFKRAYMAGEDVEIEYDERTVEVGIDVPVKIGG